MGNIAWGVPLDARGEFAGTFLGLLNPYALLMGVTTVALFAMHGAIYLVLKTEGELQAAVRRWVNPLIIAFILCYVILTLATLLYVPHITEAFRREPWFFAVVVPVVLAIANIPREVNHGREFLRLPVVVRGHGGPHGDLRHRRCIPNLVYSHAAAGTQPHRSQRRLLAKDARHHADHRADRPPDGARLQREHLLDLPRQGEARPHELLTPPMSRRPRDAHFFSLWMQPLGTTATPVPVTFMTRTQRVSGRGRVPRASTRSQGGLRPTKRSVTDSWSTSNTSTNTANICGNSRWEAGSTK